MAKSVLVTGGTGFIGKALQYYLRQKGYVVNIVSRKPGLNTITWDNLSQSGIPSNTEAIVNLVGQNILKPGSIWTEKYKQDVYTSRVNRTQDLVNEILKSQNKIKSFISFSGVGIYEPGTDTVYDEYTNLGSNPTDFFQKLTRDWEAAAQKASKDVRTTIIRSGVVLGSDGGMIKSSYWPFFFFVGGPMGSGKQPLPWIHIHDMVRIIKFTIENNKVNGVINGVAPQIITNSEFSKAFASSMSRPSFLPFPEFALNLIFSSERAKIISSGQKVKPKKLLEEYKFQYKYPTINRACAEIVSTFFKSQPFTDSREIKQ